MSDPERHGTILANQAIDAFVDAQQAEHTLSPAHGPSQDPVRRAAQAYQLAHAKATGAPAQDLGGLEGACLSCWFGPSPRRSSSQTTRPQDLEISLCPGILATWSGAASLT